eukprot:TRINITY_DN18769_c0_g1_i1.p1 TRINITY_DN18769_c0_g1~~TRINITY_DN18769_c0_g1_i1.p1  ORF type:complete len:259 (-),score=42.57 TRINITY_DN18769_c0_g1_i1:32-808(-)
MAGLQAKRWRCVDTSKVAASVAALGTTAASKRLVVLVATGCFNPPHAMHAAMFEAACEALPQQAGLEVVGGYVCPCDDNYVKCKLGTEYMPLEARLTMCELCFADSRVLKDLVTVSTCEAKGMFYEEAVQHIQDKITRTFAGLNIKVMYLCGSDHLKSTVLQVMRPHGTVIVERPTVSMPPWCARASWIVWVNSDRIQDVSSTSIRTYLSGLKDPACEQAASTLLLQNGLPGRVVDYLCANKHLIDDRTHPFHIPNRT